MVHDNAKGSLSRASSHKYVVVEVNFYSSAIFLSTLYFQGRREERNGVGQAGRKVCSLPFLSQLNIWRQKRY